MRRTLPPVLLAALASVLLATLLAFSGALLAQDGPSQDGPSQDGPTPEEVARRVEWLRQLPPDQKAKLKSALKRFHDLPPAEREALRRRAAKVGAERLDGLAGRDIETLRRKRMDLTGELDDVFASIGPERLSGCTDEEMAFLRATALRGFQMHVQRRLLGFTTYDELKALRPEERRARIAEAMERTVDDRMTRLPDEERERIERLRGPERAAARRALFADFRRDEAREFGRIFARFRLDEFLALPPAERAQRIRKWHDADRWHEVVRVLRQDVGVGDEARRDLAALGPADLAQIRVELESTADLPPDVRRARMETYVHRLAGEKAFDTGRREPEVPPYLRLLRERRMMSAPRGGGRPGGPQDGRAQDGRARSRGAPNQETPAVPQERR